MHRVFTNKTPTDAYRGAGRPEATYVIERIMDELANELGMEPLDLRRKNWIERDEFPYTTVAGLEYDSGDYEKATARATELLGYDDLRREQQARRDRNDPVQIGIGVSTYTEMCGLAPSRWLGREGYIAGGWEAATVRVLPLGKVEVVTGTHPRTARATRPRSPRSQPMRSAFPTTTSSSYTATPAPHLSGWTPTAPARWSSAGWPSSRRARRSSKRRKPSPLIS